MTFSIHVSYHCGLMLSSKSLMTKPFAVLMKTQKHFSRVGGSSILLIDTDRMRPSLRSGAHVLRTQTCQNLMKTRVQKTTQKRSNILPNMTCTNRAFLGTFSILLASLGIPWIFKSRALLPPAREHISNICCFLYIKLLPHSTRWPKFDPKWIQNGSKMDPRWTQDGSKKAQDCLSMVQGWFRKALGWPQAQIVWKLCWISGNQASLGWPWKANGWPQEQIIWK